MVNLNYIYMSPNYWNSSGNANVFIVNSSGFLTNSNVNNIRGVRPIPFLNSHTKSWQSIVALSYKINL